MNNKIPFRRIITAAFIIVVIISFSTFEIFSDLNKSHEHIIASENFHISLLKNNIESQLREVVTNIQMMSNNFIVKSYINDNSKINLKALQLDFLNTIDRHSFYDKIRFIDNNGMEVVRVNYNNAKPVIVPKNKLQNKSNRYYFHDIIKLKKDEIYFSKLDLNIEHGKIEKPRKPMLRIGEVVFANNGNKKGIIILNYFADRISKTLVKEKHKDMLGKLILTNKAGYYIRGLKSEDEFGFMFKNKMDKKFSNDFPTASNFIQQTLSGNIESNAGLFTFTTIDLNDSEIIGNDATAAFGNNHLYKLISLYKPPTLIQLFYKSKLLLFLDIFLIVFIISVLFIYQKLENKEKELEIKYSELVDNSLAGIYIVKDHIIKFVNDRTAEIYGYKNPDEMLGLNSKVFILEDKYLELLEFEREEIVSKNKKFSTYEMKSCKIDGTEIYLKLMAKIIPYQNSTAIQGTVIDITEQKLDELALQKSEQRFQHVVEATGDWIWEVDKDGLYTYSSEVSEKLLGYKPDEIIGKKHFYDFKTDISDELKKEAFEIFEKREAFKDFENTLISKSGSEITVLTNGKPIFDGSGNFIGYRGADKNISERKLAEITLKESEKKFHIMFDHAPLPYQSLDLKGYFLDVNPAWLKTLGYKKEEVIGKHFGDLMTEKSKQVMMENFKNFLSSGEVHNAQFEMIRSDGQTIIVSYEGKIAYDEFGNFKQTHCIFSDITEKKRAEKALNESEIKYRSLVETSQDLVWRCDAKGQFIYLNGAWKEITGYEIDEVLGRPFSDFLRPSEVERSVKEFETHLAGGYVKDFMVTYLSKNGDEIFLNFNAIPLYDDKNQIIGTQGTAHDITEQKLAQEKLKQKMNDLQSFNKLTVGRELKMIELKKEINELLTKLGKEKKYKIPGEDE